MNVLFLASLFIIQSFSLEGNWKLTEFTAFDHVLNSTSFEKASNEQKQEIIESLNFTLNNTYFNFKGDSLYYIDAGGRNQIRKRKGKFLLKSDTLMFFQSGKVNPMKFFIYSKKSKSFKMKVVFRDGSIASGSMSFAKVE